MKNWIQFYAENKDREVDFSGYDNGELTYFVPPPTGWYISTFIDFKVKSEHDLVFSCHEKLSDLVSRFGIPKSWAINNCNMPML